MNNALIIATSTAVSDFTSGASLRLLSIVKILKEAGYDTEIIARNGAAKYLTKEWDLIVVVSYSNVLSLVRARKNKAKIWFDATDSWRVTRKSLLTAGDYRQIVLIVRDLFLERILPHITLVSFISERDLRAEKNYLTKKTSVFFILPNSSLEREVRDSIETRFVFVGDGTYLPNKRATDFLINLYTLFPELPPTHIYGRGYEGISNDKLIIHGYDPSEVFFARDIHIAPIFFGAGVKNKVALPASNGLHVVTTHEGATGLKDLPNVHLAENYKNFATQMKKASSILDLGTFTFPIGNIFLHSEAEQVKNFLSMISQSKNIDGN
jgi:hypothetical protein